MGCQDAAFLPSCATFSATFPKTVIEMKATGPPHVIKTVIELKATGLPHVSKIVAGVSMLHVKYFCLNKASI